VINISLPRISTDFLHPVFSSGTKVFARMGVVELMEKTGKSNDI
jgi:hypothetical protein